MFGERVPQSPNQDLLGIGPFLSVDARSPCKAKFSPHLWATGKNLREGAALSLLLPLDQCSLVRSLKEISSPPLPSPLLIHT